MNQKHQKIRKCAQLIGAVSGGLLLSFPIIPQIATAQQLNTQVNPQINPCPSIFYEEPHNERVLVPQGCPPNALTQRYLDQGLLTESNPSPAQTRLGVGGEAPNRTNSGALNPNPSIFQEAPFNRAPQTLPDPSALPAPAPSVQTQPPREQAPIATITPMNGRVDVRLVNSTAANITYQVVGDTAPRSLQGKSNVLLQGLRAPVTVTFYREDRGLLAAIPQRTSAQGTLEVTLSETTEVGTDRRAMRIGENGSVYLN
ncbi:hypothetical protein [Fortiea contorta]|uniref:hypothetical protein n=1 Tax=Fortiea contorta TaxID=1892405 RepID=UPI000347E90B|nr:hypothetical protein [Fortiea contorta]